MTLEEFEAKAHRIYAKYNMAVRGYHDYNGCIEPCCYPNLHNEKQGLAEMAVLWQALLPGHTLCDYPGDYSSISASVTWAKQLLCTHSWQLVGESSMTSIGTADRYICANCAQGKYIRKASSKMPIF